ncbi:DUF11 domain-containing protein [Corticibacter populi]|uniref:DUF11 domain-containing protein n=1 Tax=Corticibacter populi TaxID=1550736 RepID=A0A3M6QSD8_9BURK|nr:DUF11 domain-containing protein [Corticibacter populi]RMX05945.1 DUF11 domain-containing protein [Corticibacter populi]RZS30730.1 putative repeat protein (TIGR01451 family) [Corticibacter populi]
MTGMKKHAASSLALLALLALPASAQVKRTFTNLSFESPNLVSAGCRVYIPQQFVEGWNSDHPNRAAQTSGTCTVPAGFSGASGAILELWRGPRNNNSGGAVTGRTGAQFAELNADAASRIYQDICLINGENVNYFFSHRGRYSASVRDVMTMLVGTGANSEIVTVSTTNTGAYDPPVSHQGSAQAPSLYGGGWVDYRGQFTYQGPSGLTNIGFEAVSAAGGIQQGNFLDDIQVELAPFVDFPQVSSSTPESSTSNVPTLRVNGTLAASVTVDVKITGGTAQLGVDYQFASGAVVINGDTLRITIPAGTYNWSGTGQFPLPIQVINNTAVDGNRNLQFTIQPAQANQYLLASSSSCGGSVNTGWNYTIADDDASVVVTKEVTSTSQVGDDPALHDVVYTIEVNNPSATNTATYSLVDRPGMDSDVSITAASYTVNGGGANALSPLTGSPIEWTLASGVTLAAGATNTYQLTARVRIARGGSVGNDACTGAAGNGLFNQAEAIVAGVTGALVGSACTPTPTPVWVTLAKSLEGRSVAGDQIAVRIYAGGIQRAEVQTSGTSVPQTVSTVVQVFQPGSLIGFGDVVGPNGSFASGAHSPAAYDVAIACSNANTGSATVLPSGAGTDEGTRQFWGQFGTHAGDDISCMITNKLPTADLSIVKTVSSSAAPVGGTVTFKLVVANAGPANASNVVVRDPAVDGLDCVAAPACSVLDGAAACPASPSIDALQGATGLVIPAMNAGGSVELTLVCTVTAPTTP